jgi:hypothetical protein
VGVEEEEEEEVEEEEEEEGGLGRITGRTWKTRGGRAERTEKKRHQENSGTREERRVKRTIHT